MSKGGSCGARTTASISTERRSAGVSIPQRGALLDLILPSGDKRRAGDFDMWFWIVPPPLPPLRVDSVEFWGIDPATGGQRLAGTATPPLAQGAPPPKFSKADGISALHIAFNRDIQAAGMVVDGQPQAAKIEVQIPGGQLTRIHGDLSMLPGSQSAVVFTCKDPSFLSQSFYRLTVIGSPNETGFVAVTATDGSGLDGTYNGTLGLDFVLPFEVALQFDNGVADTGETNR